MIITLPEQLRAGKLLTGSWLNSGSMVAAEVAGLAGFDWLLIDREHGSGSEADVPLQIMAVGLGGAAAVVRVSGIDAAEIKRVADFGPAGIMVPSIDSAAEAMEVVRCVRIPPLGGRQMATSTRAVQYGRGYAEYLVTNNERLLVAVQIESGAAVEAAGAIAAVDGIDVLFVGPTDLATSIGSDPVVFKTALLAVVSAAWAHGKGAGILARTVEQAREYFELGFRMIAMGSDRGILAAGFDRAAASLEKLRT